MLQKQGYLGLLNLTFIDVCNQNYLKKMQILTYHNAQVEFMEN